jgi:hypothetical protein
VKPIDIGGGKASVQRPDGGVYFGPDQGNTGKPGWFDAKGNRMGDADGQATPAPGFLGGLASGLKTAGRAVAQTGAQFVDHVMQGAMPTGTYDPGQIQGVNQDFAQRQAVADAEVARGGLKAKVGSFIGQAVPVVAATVATGGEAPAATYLGRVAQALPAAVSTAVATTPGTEKQKGVAGALAIPGTFAGQGLTDSLGWIGKKAASSLAGTTLGNKLGIPTALNPKYAGAPALSQELDQAGITAHTVGDITGDPVVRAHENALARNNPAMMELRLKENEQASAYAQRVVEDLQTTVRQTGWKTVADVEKAAVEPGKRQGAAKTLLTALQNSGDDWKEIAQQSGNLNLFVNKLKADQLYDKAEGIARLYGPVDPANLVGSLKASIGAIQRNTAADQSSVPYLQRILTGIEDGSQNTGFGDLREMRTALNNKLSEMVDPKSVVQGSSDARPYLQNTIDALERDLDKFAKGHSSGMRNAWQAATDHYRTQVVPYKEAAFGRALADTDPLKAANLFMGQNTAQQTRFFGLLDPKGQAAIRAGLVEDAIGAGEKTQRGVMGQTFGAASAALKLEQLQRNGVMSVAFPGGQDNWAASGLAKILRTVDRSDNVGFTPPTGVTAQSIGAKVEGNQTMFGTVLKGIDWLNKDRLMALYSDPKGRALLIHASNLTPGSPAMNNLINNQIPKVLGVTAGRMGSSTASAPETPNDLSTPPR